MKTVKAIRTSKPNARRRVYEVAQRLFPGIGCGDASCVFGHGHVGGLLRTGGCPCIDGDRAQARMQARRLAAIAVELAGERP